MRVYWDRAELRISTCFQAFLFISSMGFCGRLNWTNEFRVRPVRKRVPCGFTEASDEVANRKPPLVQRRHQAGQCAEIMPEPLRWNFRSNTRNRIFGDRFDSRQGRFKSGPARYVLINSIAPKHPAQG